MLGRTEGRRTDLSLGGRPPPRPAASSSHHRIAHHQRSSASILLFCVGRVKHEHEGDGDNA